MHCTLRILDTSLIMYMSERSASLCSSVLHYILLELRTYFMFVDYKCRTFRACVKFLPSRRSIYTAPSSHPFLPLLQTIDSSYSCIYSNHHSGTRTSRDPTDSVREYLSINSIFGISLETSLVIFQASILLLRLGKYHGFWFSESCC